MSYKERFKEQLRVKSIYNDPKVREHGLHFDSNRDRKGWSDAFPKKTNVEKKDEGSER